MLRWRTDYEDTLLACLAALLLLVGYATGVPAADTATTVALRILTAENPS